MSDSAIADMRSVEYELFDPEKVTQRTQAAVSYLSVSQVQRFESLDAMQDRNIGIAEA